MKANSKIFFVLIVLCVVLLSVSAHAEHITDASTPDDCVLKWATQIGEGWQKSAGEPVIIGDKIVIMAGDEIHAVNKATGEIVRSASMAEEQSYGYVAPTYAGDKIYMNLSNGTIQAFDAQTLESVWVYKHPGGGKGMTAVTYSDNTVFTGFWDGETKYDDFVALDISTGELKWSKTVNGGFYWTGAYCTDSAVIFGTDDGSDKVSHIYSCNKETGEVISCIDVENKGDIRSSVTYYNGRIFVTTKGGYIISAALSDNVLSDVKYGEIGAASTSTPVIYNDRIYIGASDKTISVFDCATLDKLFSVPVTAYPQCTPLISTYYSDTGYIYLYTTYNKTPGGVTLIKIKEDATAAEDCTVIELYNAQGYEQYCISNVICDNEGTLYYKNDSGYLFALSDSISLKASFAEDGYIYAPADIAVAKNTAESYGYTDTVTDGVSALDVLVKIHENMLADEFTLQTADSYLSVSSEGYLSRVMGIDTYNFGFAVNGTAPHDDILTQYGYTGYSLNQAPVKNSDKVEFFIYRDSWAMDNYGIFSQNDTKTDHVFANVGEEVKIKLEGYSFGWYSCAEDSTIKENTFPIADAKILLGEEQLTATDAEGYFTIAFDFVGKYTLTATEGEGSTPLIPAQIEFDVLGFELIEEADKVYLISNLEEEEENVWVIKAQYTLDEMISAETECITLPKGYQKLEIETSDKGEETKIFVWNKSLTPLTGGVTR